MFAEIEIVFGTSGDVSFYSERKLTLAELNDHEAKSIAECGANLAGFEVLRVGEDRIYAFRTSPENQCDINIVSDVVRGYCSGARKQTVKHKDEATQQERPYIELPQANYLFELQPIQ